MSSSQRSVKVLGVFTVPARLPELIVVLEAERIWSLPLDESWFFDPASRTTWRSTSLAHATPPSDTTQVRMLAKVSGNGELVDGLELQLVPIGWQP
jgi:hypothetical protein